MLGAPLPPDDPRRRLVWVVPAAVLLVLLVLFLSAYGLHPQTQKTHSLPPVDAQIYELPAQQGSAPAKPTRQVAPRAPAKPAARPVPKVNPPPAVAHTAPKVTAPKAPALPAPRITTPPAHAPQAAISVPKPKVHHPAPPRPAVAKPSPAKRPLNWATLSSQMNSVASSVISHSQFAQIHDPHTLVARYYIEAVLEKLQRIGDMVYTGRQVGTVAVRLIIGSDGSVQVLELSPQGGVVGLEAVARQIVDLSAPFSPFPKELLKNTTKLKLTVNMQFLGFHSVNAY
ncbi:hypothetical protein BW247_02005 [Acidihalobacter ferrooxydans]|uniref:TonB C-terminal domain-containing protein n=1 Tax=Acidihalobacter ferrooxydans TaxID=1765967 RepID=A0A1P8UDT2_9GAMM|nr:hypothetical protein BW247_02005 [Acidihalobacter ferrooxydans]